MEENQEVLVESWKQLLFITWVHADTWGSPDETKVSCQLELQYHELDKWLLETLSFVCYAEIAN